MIIAIINFTNGSISDEAVLAAIRAINRQIAEGFEPYIARATRTVSLAQNEAITRLRAVKPAGVRTSMRRLL